MSDTQETIADIIAEKRRRADEIERDCAEKMKRGEMVSDCYARELVADIRREADRLEAAHRREVREAEDLFRKSLKKQEDTLRDQYEALVGFSNRAKLREALESVKELARTIYSTSDKGSSHEDLAEKIVELANAALAAPPRNCDALSVQEQTEKFNQFCQSHRHSDLPKCAGCPLEDIPDGTGCAQAWGQMPYESEAAK